MANNVTFNIELNGNAYEGVLHLKTGVEELTKSVENAKGTLGKLGDSAFKLNSIIDTVRNIGKAFESLAGPAMDMELQKMNMTTLFQGNAAAAESMYNKISDYAQNTVYDQSGLLEAQKTMMLFGVEGEKAFGMLKRIGDVAMGSKENMQSLTLAFAQMSSLGKLTSNDMKQMVNAGFNPLNELCKMTGLSMEELEKAMSKGAISADMVAAAFENATEEGGLFYQAAEKASETTAGKIAKLQGKVDKLKASVFVASGSLGVYAVAFTPVLETMASLIPLFERAKGAITKIAVPIGNFIVMNAKAIKEETKLWGITGMLKAEFNHLTTSGIGKAVISMGALIKRTVQSTLSFVRFSAVALVNTIKGLGSLALSFVTSGAASVTFAATASGAFATVKVAACTAIKAIGNAFKSVPIFLAIGVIISAIQSLMEHWESIKTAFADGGIIAGLKRVGFALLDAILKPVQKLLELLSNIPGLGFLAKKGADAIQSLRTNLDNLTVVPPKKEQSILGEKKDDQQKIKLDPTGSLGCGTLGGTSGTSAGKAQQINITLRSMVDTMNFNGGMRENAADVESQLKEMLARILGMAATAV